VPELARHTVICLTHRDTPRWRTQQVSGNVAVPFLGLDNDVYDSLAKRVDTVIHCAAVTDFAAGADAISELNVRGTQNIVRFAADANATMHYVSTAFVARADLTREQVGEAAADPTDYLASKRAAEQMVRDAGIKATIVRPSVVIGDSATGEIAKFQGLHTLASALLKNTLPLLPLDPASRIDFVPQDVLAKAVAGLVDKKVDAGEYWVTAGDAALTARAMVDIAVEAGQRLGIEIVPPRLVQPDMVDRLIRPVFVAPLPAMARRRFDDMLAMTALFAGAHPFESSLATMPGVTAVTQMELRAAFAASVSYLALAKNLAVAPRMAMA
jgi:nucleoside-diphosphate-sugar epimerase